MASGNKTILLTFLGKGNYHPVTYTWDGKCAKPTHLLPIAVDEFFAPQKIVLFVTSQVRDNEHFKTLEERVGSKLQVVDIPMGRSQAELWEVFEQVASAVEGSETVILDITHAFRSIPMIVFAAAAYLRQTKNVSIQHILYGAFDARKPSRVPPQPEDQVPLFDLTGLLELLDWSSGAESFFLQGYAELVAEKIQNTHRALWKTGIGTPEKLNSLGERLKTLSRALHLSRPREVMKLASDLLPLLEEAKSELEQWAKPFFLLIDRLRTELEPLGYGEPDKLTTENLRVQLNLIKYYCQKRLTFQALTLAREWLVNCVALQKGEGDWLDKNLRQDIEEGINRLSIAAREEKKSNIEGDKLYDWLSKTPISSEVANVWNRLADLRNDLAHCGMRKGPRSSESIEKELKQILTALLRIFSSMCDSPGTSFHSHEAQDKAF